MPHLMWLTNVAGNGTEHGSFCQVLFYYIVNIIKEVRSVKIAQSGFISGKHSLYPAIQHHTATE